MAYKAHPRKHVHAIAVQTLVSGAPRVQPHGAIPYNGRRNLPGAMKQPATHKTAGPRQAPDASFMLSTCACTCTCSVGAPAGLPGVTHARSLIPEGPSLFVNRSFSKAYRSHSILFCTRVQHTTTPKKTGMDNVCMRARGMQDDGRPAHAPAPYLHTLHCHDLMAGCGQGLMEQRGHSLPLAGVLGHVNLQKSGHLGLGHWGHGQVKANQGTSATNTTTTTTTTAAAASFQAKRHIPQVE